MHVLINMPPVVPPTTRHPGHWTCHRVILLFTLSIIMLLGFVVLGGGTSMLSVYRQGDTRRCIYVADMVIQSDTKRDLLHELVTAWQCDLTAAQLPVTVRPQQGREPPLCEGGLLSRLHRGVVGTIATGVALAVAALCGYAGVFANKSAPLAMYMVVTLVLVLLELGAVGILVYNKSELDKIQPHADFLLSQPAAEQLVTSPDGLLTAGGPPLPTRRLPSARAGAAAGAGEDFGGFRPPTTRPPLGRFAPPRGNEPPPPPPPAVNVEDILIKIAGRRGKAGKASKVGDLAPRVKANATGEEDENNATASPVLGDVVPYDLDNETETEHVDFVPLGDVSPSPSYHNSSALPYDLSKESETGNVNGNVSAERISTDSPAEDQLLNSETNLTKNATLNKTAVTSEAVRSKAAEGSSDAGPEPDASSSSMFDVGGGANSSAVPVEDSKAGVLSLSSTGSPLKSSTLTGRNQTADAKQAADVYIASGKVVANATLITVHHTKSTPKANNEEHELADRHEKTPAPVHQGKQHTGGTLPPPNQPNSHSSDQHHQPVHTYHDVAPEPFTDTTEHKVTNHLRPDKATTHMPISPAQTYEAVDPGPNSYYGTFTEARFSEDDYEASNATRSRQRRSQAVHVAAEEAEAVVNHWAAASIQCSPPDTTPLDVPCFAKLENNLQTELDRAALLVDLLLTPLVCAFLACVLQLATLCATWHLIRDRQRAPARPPPGPARPPRPDTAV